jgi:hypothetical protein
MFRRLTALVAHPQFLTAVAAGAALWGIGHLAKALGDCKEQLAAATDELAGVTRDRAAALDDYEALMEKRGKAYRDAVAEAEERSKRERYGLLDPAAPDPVFDAITASGNGHEASAPASAQVTPTPATLAKTSKRAD